MYTLFSFLLAVVYHARRNWFIIVSAAIVTTATLTLNGWYNNAFPPKAEAHSIVTLNSYPDIKLQIPWAKQPTKKTTGFSVYSPPSGLDLSKFDENTRLSDTDLRSIILKAGFPEEKVSLVMAISRAESGGRPRALNWSSTDRSYGIFQINMKGSLGAARMNEYGLANVNDLFDPLVNAKIAYIMSNGGRDWSPWSAYKNGSFQKYL